LFYVTRDLAMMAVDLELGPAPRVGIPRKLFQLDRIGGQIGLGYGISPDGQRFLISRPHADNPDTPITVVLNWWADLANRPK